MPQAIRARTDDPAQQIWDKINRVMAGRPLPDLVQVDDVLVALWEGSEKTAGGVYMPQQHLDEHVYQGKTGLVIAMGVSAFKADADHVWPERVPRVGDWVVFRISDGWPLVLGGREGQHCRLLTEARVRAVVSSPDVVY